MSNMIDITVSIDEETYRQARIRVAKRRRLLNDIWADFDKRGIGLRSSENLSRGELYEEAMKSGIDEREIR